MKRLFHSHSVTFISDSLEFHLTEILEEFHLINGANSFSSVTYNQLNELVESKVIESGEFICNKYRSILFSLYWRHVYVSEIRRRENLIVAKSHINWKLCLVIIHVANRKLAFLHRSQITFVLLWLKPKRKNVDSRICIDCVVLLYCVCLHYTRSFWGNESLLQTRNFNCEIWKDLIAILLWIKLHR